MRRLSVEPLLLFLLAGGALFAVDRLVHPPETTDLVEAPSLAAAREEVLFREAVRQGLDRGDPIIRARLVQKMEFLLADGARVEEPTDAEVRAEFERAPERYRGPGSVQFSVQTDAGLWREEPAHTLVEVAAAYGAPFARALFELDGGTAALQATTGPLLVRIDQRQQAAQASLPEVAADVRAELMAARRQQAEVKAYEALERRYRVRVSAP